MMQSDFSFSDFLGQMKQVQHLRPMTKLLGKFGMSDEAFASEIRKVFAVANSMTPWEQAHPESLTASRRRRIASGAGMTTVQVSKVLLQFETSRQLMNPIRSGWRGRVAVALGLVTSDPSHRDPSYVSPIGRWVEKFIVAAIAVIAILVIAYSSL